LLSLSLSPPSGPWLKYKGHLENIANNTLIGAINADTGKVNSVVSQLSGKEGTVPGTPHALSPPCRGVRVRVRVRTKTDLTAHA
jgi:hypothetical protein